MGREKRQSGKIADYEIGDRYIIATDISFKGNEQFFEFHIRLPKTTELFLSIAEKSWQSYREKNNHIGELISTEYKDITKETVIGDGKLLSMIYDSFEESYKSLVFSAMALESFANNLIPYDYKDSKGRTKEKIERYETLENKLKVIIPNAFKISSPENQPWWKELVNLNTTRNELVHLKYHDIMRYIKGFMNPSILLPTKPFPKTTITIIEYYCNECQIERGLFLPDRTDT